MAGAMQGHEPMFEDAGPTTRLTLLDGTTPSEVHGHGVWGHALAVGEAVVDIGEDSVETGGQALEITSVDVADTGAVTEGADRFQGSEGDDVSQGKGAYADAGSGT